MAQPTLGGSGGFLVPNPGQAKAMLPENPQFRLVPNRFGKKNVVPSFEEQFGPILPVLRYTDLDDAVARANDTEYGLGGSVWSADRERAFAVAARIDAGTVWVNQHLDMRPDIPFGGAKQSGVGVELGLEGLGEFTQATIINMAK